MKEKMMEKIVMHKIPDLLKLGITLESACEFAKISVEEYEEYKKQACERRISNPPLQVSRALSGG